MINLYKLIEQTNGDALGVVLFILLILYFIIKMSKEKLNYFEIFLLSSCSIALIVDLHIVRKYILHNLLSNHI